MMLHFQSECYENKITAFEITITLEENIVLETSHCLLEQDYMIFKFLIFLSNSLSRHFLITESIFTISLVSLLNILSFIFNFIYNFTSVALTLFIDATSQSGECSNILAILAKYFWHQYRWFILKVSIYR